MDLLALFKSMVGAKPPEKRQAVPAYTNNTPTDNQALLAAQNQTLMGPTAATPPRVSIPAILAQVYGDSLPQELGAANNYAYGPGKQGVFAYELGQYKNEGMPTSDYFMRMGQGSVPLESPLGTSPEQANNTALRRAVAPVLGGINRRSVYNESVLEPDGVSLGIANLMGTLGEIQRGQFQKSGARFSDPSQYSDFIKQLSQYPDQESVDREIGHYTPQAQQLINSHIQDVRQNSGLFKSGPRMMEKAAYLLPGLVQNTQVAPNVG